MGTFNVPFTDQVKPCAVDWREPPSLCRKV